MPPYSEQRLEQAFRQASVKSAMTASTAINVSDPDRAAFSALRKRMCRLVMTATHRNSNYDFFSYWARTLRTSVGGLSLFALITCS